MNPVIFFNTALMERYEGLPDLETEIWGGGSYGHTINCKGSVQKPQTIKLMVFF